MLAGTGTEPGTRARSVPLVVRRVPLPRGFIATVTVAMVSAGKTSKRRSGMSDNDNSLVAVPDEIVAAANWSRDYIYRAETHAEYSSATMTARWGTMSLRATALSSARGKENGGNALCKVLPLSRQLAFISFVDARNSLRQNSLLYGKQHSD